MSGETSRLMLKADLKEALDRAARLEALVGLSGAFRERALNARDEEIRQLEQKLRDVMREVDSVLSDHLRYDSVSPAVVALVLGVFDRHGITEEKP